MKQLSAFHQESKTFNKPYGGVLLNTRTGRQHGRPLDTKSTMHLVLKSSKAKGAWSFKRPQNEKKIAGITHKFARKYGVKILSMANVGNHLHFQIKLTNRHAYKAFIRAITGSIAMAVTGLNRWEKNEKEPGTKLKFWDYRPFTRVVRSLRAYLNLKDYIQINRLEGFGATKLEARFLFKMSKLKMEYG